MHTRYFVNNNVYTCLESPSRWKTLLSEGRDIKFYGPLVFTENDWEELFLAETIKNVVTKNHFCRSFQVGKMSSYLLSSEYYL